MWLTNGGSSNPVAVLVKTDERRRHAVQEHDDVPGGEGARFGETAQGVTIPGKIDKMGYKGVDTTELVRGAPDLPPTRSWAGSPARALPDDGRRRGGSRQRGRARGRRREPGLRARDRVRPAAGDVRCRTPSTRRSSSRLAEMATKVETAHAMMVRAARAARTAATATTSRPAWRSTSLRSTATRSCRTRSIHGGYGYSKGVRDRASLPRGGLPADRRGHRRHPEDDHRPQPAEGLQAQGLRATAHNGVDGRPREMTRWGAQERKGVTMSDSPNEDLKAKMREALDRKYVERQGVSQGQAGQARRRTAPRWSAALRRCTGARPAEGPDAWMIRPA